MPRRAGVPKRDVLPDPKYGNKVITKLINQVMLDGKKAIAQNIVYGAFDIIQNKLGVEPDECRELQIIVDRYSELCRYLSKKMFTYGAKLSKK